jgi:hypothetical protein
LVLASLTQAAEEDEGDSPSPKCQEKELLEKTSAKQLEKAPAQLGGGDANDSKFEQDRCFRKIVHCSHDDVLFFSRLQDFAENASHQKDCPSKQSTQQVSSQDLGVLKSNVGRNR